MSASSQPSSKKPFRRYKDPISITHSELSEEWNTVRNGSFLPNQITAGSQKKVWWFCDKGHEWEAGVSLRVNGRQCPICIGRAIGVNGEGSLAHEFPEIAKEWHPSKNAPLAPKQVTAGTIRKVWWECSICKYDWESKVQARTRVGGKDGNCPSCTKK